MLDRAWVETKTHILMFSAWGGVGKTALVNHWLSRMEQENYRGAAKVYGWSFYSQGTKEDRQASGDEFLAHALQWFGDPDSNKGSPWDKGVRLAERIRLQRTLLILDGLEPLQYPADTMKGRLRDQGILSLLKALARAGTDWGLCILTTRLAVYELLEMKKASVKDVPVENLSEDAGVKLLRNLGVIKGTDCELEEAVREFKGHALALTLLGRCLAVMHGGEIRKRDLVSLADDIPDDAGREARRVMRSYEIWLHGTPELALLNLMGLFDRPAEGGAIEVLRKEPAIQGLTDTILNLNEAQWKFAIEYLRELRLLDKRDEVQPDTLDCHPLIREHFGEKLKKENPIAWKEAHSRLYEYFRDLPEKREPDTLSEMEPLFRAVMHGCQAGRHQETGDEVYWKRIRRETEAYSVRQLGAFGADLAALANFFEVPWSRPVNGLTDEKKAVVLGWAGFRLRALGRLREAREPMEIGLQMSIRQENWKNAARAAGNLSELSLTLGEVTTAIDYARQSVEFADRSGDALNRLYMRTALAGALHQQGELSLVERLFLEAEKLQQKEQSEYPFLYSNPGYRFCDLLLSQGNFRQVQERANQALKWVIQKGLLLDIALDNLSLGRAALLQAQTVKTGTFEKARQYLNQAVQGLREAGAQEFIVLGLLSKAELYRVTKSFTDSWRDLEEAKEIAERGDMQLYLADFHLEAARLFRAVSKATKTPKKAAVIQEFFKSYSDSEELASQNQASNPDYAKIAMTKAREHFATAKEMVDRMGYGRRKPELAELEKQLKTT